MSTRNTPSDVTNEDGPIREPSPAGVSYPNGGHALDPGCSRCPDLADCRTRIAWGNGDPDADVMVVGEAPAAGDPDADRWQGGNLTGLAYTSRHSGRRIRRLVAACGYADRTYYTNSVKCFPRDTDAERETNREPTPAERRRCSDHLRTELDSVRPSVVCPTGKHATAAVLALVGCRIEDVADGFIATVLQPIELDGLEVGSTDGTETDAHAGSKTVTVLPLLHPSYRDVWAPRIGYETADAYRDAVREALSTVVD